VIISIFATMIDFVYNIILGFDYPGLTKALDPITIGLLVGQGVQQIGKVIGANQQKKAAEAQAREGKDLYDQMVGDFESGKYDMQLSQDVRDVGEQQRMYAEQVADQASQRATASMQSALAASRYGDPRSAAMLPQQLDRLEAGAQKAELAGLQQKVRADAAVAGAQQTIDEKNAAMMQSLGSMKLRRGAGQMDAGNLAAQQAQQARTDALTGLASTAAQGIAMGGSNAAQTRRAGPAPVDMTELNTIDPSATDFRINNDVFKALSGSRGLLTQGGLPAVDPSSGASLADRIALNEFTGRQSDRSQPMSMSDLFGLLNMQGRSTLGAANVFADPNAMGPFMPDNYQKGGQYKFADKGGEVHMTEGEFSHKTNKKALIDEETGEKEAELTGDEAMVRDGENVLVFNPNQQSTIEALVNKGDSKALMKKMKALLKKFNKQNV